MIVFPSHPILTAPLHNGTFTWDEFACIGLIALALVIATFVVRGGEKGEEDSEPPAGPDQPAEKPAGH